MNAWLVKTFLRGQLLMVWCDAKNLSWIWSWSAFAQIMQNPSTAFLHFQLTASWDKLTESWTWGQRSRKTWCPGRKGYTALILHWIPPSAPAEQVRNSPSDPWKAFSFLMPAFGLNSGNLIRHWGSHSSAAQNWNELPGKAARMNWSCTQGDGWMGATIPASRQKWGVSVLLKSCSDLPFCDFYPDDAFLQYWCFVSACCYYHTPLPAPPLLTARAVQVAGLTRAEYFWPGILWLHNHFTP